MTEETAGREKQTRRAAAGGITKRGWGARDVIGSITGRKQAEEALRASEARFRSTLDSMMEGALIIGFDWRYLYANDAVARHTSQRKEELLGHSMMEMHPGIENTPEFAHLRRCMEERVAHRMEWRYVYPDGATAWFDVGVQPVPEGIFMLFLNITERKRAEEALRESEERYRDLVENLNDVIFEVDASRHVTYMSPIVEQILGYTPVEMIGHDFSEFVYSGDLPALMDRFQKSLTEKTEPLEYRAVSKSGEIRWIRHFSRPILDGDRVVGFRGVQTDITERKRAEEEVREGEERYRDVAENLNDAIFELDTSGRITHVSSGMEGLSGYSASEMIGRPTTDFLHPDDLAAITDRIRQRPFGGREPSEYRLLTKSGEARWVRSLGQPVFEGDRMVSFRGVLTDITEHKLAEEGLRQSEEKYRELVENINEAIYELDANGEMTYISPVVEEVGGYSPSEIVGRPATDFVHPDDLPRVAEGFRSAVSGHPTPNEYRLLCKTGEVLWVRSFGRPILEGERVVGVRGVLTDITEGKRAEEALRESEERYRELVENINETIYEMDADGRITYISPAAEQAIGYPPSEIVGRPFADFFHPDDLSSAVQGFQRALSGHPTPNQYRLLSKTGEVLWVLSFGQPVLRGQRIVGVRGVITDVTESKRAEEALREGAEAVRWLSDATSDIIISVRVDGTILSVNAAVERTLGYRAEDMVGKNLAEFVHPEDVAAVRATAEERLRGSPDNSAAECRVRHSDGSWRIVETIGRISTDNKGEIIPVLSVRDVTERKGAEEGLRESEERFRQVAATAGEWISEIDAGGRFTYSSPAVKKILGYEPAEVIGKRFYDFYPAEEREQLLAGARRIGARKKAYSGAIARNVHKDGRTVVVESSGLPILDAGGNVLGYRNVARDITERKRAEEALRESEERFRGIFESAFEGIVIHENSVILDANPAFERMYRYQLSELVGKSLLSLTAKESRDLVLQMFRSACEETYEAVALRKDGTTFRAEVLARQRTYKGRRVRVVAVRDITERKRAEEELKQSEEKWRSLVENAPDIIMTVSADSTILSINHTVPGMTVDSVIGTSLYDYLPPEDRDKQRTALEEVFETGEPQSYEIAGKGPAGATSWYFSRIGPIVQDGTVVAAVLVTTDITEHRQAEEELRASEARLRAFANAVPDVAFILDENGMYVEVLAAPETKDLLYTNGDALRGQRLHDVLPKKSADQFLSMVRKTIETQEPQILEYVLDVQAGRRWFEGRTAPLSLPGEKQTVVWVSHDITERKQAEAGREKAREALDRKVERAAKRGGRYGLSFRELTVLDLVSTGKSDRDIASVLGIRPRTVSKHVENIRAKMGASSRTEAGVRAIKEKLLG